MFTPISVKCFTSRTGLPAGSSPLENPLHSVVKVLIAYGAYYRWTLSLYSAGISILSKILHFCLLLAHPFPSESFACRLRTGRDSSLTSYPPMPPAGLRQHRQVLAHSGGSTPEV
jgi:hypothetical protein